MINLPKYSNLAFIVFTVVLLACTSGNSSQQASFVPPQQLEGQTKAYFASGCFWCVEAIFESVRGVSEVVSGYSGGEESNPTYRQVARGATGHTEAVEVYYDPEVVSFETLVEVYYGSHNPTTVNGQAPDFGRQYRSVIFYQNAGEKTIAEKWKNKVASDYDEPIATEITSFEKFWPAEEYHQDFEVKNPYQPYVQAVSIPRLKKFQSKFPHLLKDDSAH